jgi:hypothetical protein
VRTKFVCLLLEGQNVFGCRTFVPKKFDFNSVDPAEIKTCFYNYIKYVMVLVASFQRNAFKIGFEKLLQIP